MARGILHPTAMKGKGRDQPGRRQTSVSHRADLTKVAITAAADLAGTTTPTSWEDW